MNRKTNHLMSVFTALLIALFTVNAASAAVVANGGAQFSLSSAATSPFNDVGNELAVSGVSASSSHGAFPVSNLIDDDLGHADGRWVAGAFDVTVTFNFAPGADILGMKIDWGWDDRDDGTHEILINGLTSLGSIDVENAGTSGGSADPVEGPTYLLFDALQSGVTSVVLDISGDDINTIAYSEITFYTAAVPTPAALPAGLAMLGLVAMRRRR